MSNKFWYNWLILTTLGVMLFSLVLVLIPHELQTVLDDLYLADENPAETFSPEAYHYLNFVFGVLGGVMLGWMAAIFYILVTLFKYGERLGWRLITLSLLTWFVVDSSASLITGFWQNAVLNAVFLLLFAIPLFATYREFHASEAINPRTLSRKSAV